LLKKLLNYFMAAGWQATFSARHKAQKLYFTRTWGKLEKAARSPHSGYLPSSFAGD
jgi:hypothetical protein